VYRVGRRWKLGDSSHERGLLGDIAKAFFLIEGDLIQRFEGEIRSRCMGEEEIHTWLEGREWPDPQLRAALRETAACRITLPSFGDTEGFYFCFLIFAN